MKLSSTAGAGKHCGFSAGFAQVYAHSVWLRPLLSSLIPRAGREGHELYVANLSKFTFRANSLFAKTTQPFMFTEIGITRGNNLMCIWRQEGSQHIFSDRFLEMSYKKNGTDFLLMTEVICTFVKPSFLTITIFIIMIIIGKWV